MGTIADIFESVWRDYVTEGVPSSGENLPNKAEIRPIGALIEQALASSVLGAVDVAYATRAALDADLAHAAGATALVYADATDANNDLYVKTGAAGAGSWTLTSAFHNAIALLAQPYVDDAATEANRAEAAATSIAAFASTAVPSGYLFGLLDGSVAKRMALGVSDGTAAYDGATIPAGGVVAAYFATAALRATAATLTTLNGRNVEAFLTSVVSLGSLSALGAAGASAFALIDESLAQRASRMTTSSGAEVIADLSAQKFDGMGAADFYRAAIGRPNLRGGGCFRAQFDFVASTGQSNSQGANAMIGIGAFALDALAMAANSLTPGTPFVLSPANLSLAAAGNTETPLFAFASAVRRRLIAENMITANDQTYRPIISNNGIGGTSIAQRSKSGTPPGGLVGTYAQTIAAFTKAYNDAQAGSLPGTTGPVVVKCLSLLNVDGETDATQGVTGAAYKATSVQRMTDFATDIKAINNQTETPVELLFQCLSNQNRLTGAVNIVSGGSGGTNGTFALIVAAPPQVSGASGVAAAGTFTVSGGAVTAITVSNKGAGYRGDVALSNAAFANSAGLTGASAVLLSETVTMPIGTAQRELGQTSAQHVVVGPFYQFNYERDYQHPDANGARRMGALAAAAHKALWVDQAGAQADKSRWACLQPTAVTRSGKCVHLRFDNAVGFLSFATLPWMGLEPNYGFSLVDSGGAALTISSVAIVGPREILIAAASTIPAGAKVRYGFNTMTARNDYYSGGGGNLRDNQGQWLKDEYGVPLHNWAIAFSETL